MKEIEFYKNEPHIQVYRDLSNPDIIVKKYIVDGDEYESREDLQAIRAKLLNIKNCENWPEFVIKPQKILPLIGKSFKAYLPFVNGPRLDEYLKTHDIDLSTCAKFISGFEKSIMGAKDFVFPDIANFCNIIILPIEADQLLFCVIDPDDIQFAKYGCTRVTVKLGVVLSGRIPPRGKKKCFDSNKIANKQLDIRSMYALYYAIMNGKENFYPKHYERAMEEYHVLLRSFNVPIGSTLYKQSIATLSDDKPNEVISDSLFELVDAGYDFEIYNRNSAGPQYRLTRKRIPVYQSPKK